MQPSTPPNPQGQAMAVERMRERAGRLRQAYRKVRTASGLITEAAGYIDAPEDRLQMAKARGAIDAIAEDVKAELDSVLLTIDTLARETT